MCFPSVFLPNRSKSEAASATFTQLTAVIASNLADAD